MRKLLLTMLVALLALPAFADDIKTVDLTTVDEPSGTIGGEIAYRDFSSAKPGVGLGVYAPRASFAEGYIWTTTAFSSKPKKIRLTASAVSGNVNVNVFVFTDIEKINEYFRDLENEVEDLDLGEDSGSAVLKTGLNEIELSNLPDAGSYYVLTLISASATTKAVSATITSIEYDYSAEVVPTLTWSKANIEQTGYSIAIGDVDVIPAFAKVSPNGSANVIYSSSEETVATIDEDGAVTAVGLGTTEITAELDKYPTVIIRYQLTVTPATAILSFDTTTSRTATLGSDYTAPELTAKVNGVIDPNVTVKYESSNTKVAEVNSTTGAITLVSAGETTITASVTGTEYEASPVSYTLTVNAKVAELKWSATSCTAYLGATNTFPTLTNTERVPVKYDSSNRAIADVDDDGNVTLNATGSTGSVTITASIDTAAEGGKDYAAASATYTLVVKNGFDWVSDAVPSGTYYYGQVFDLPKVVPATGVSGDIKVEYSASPDNVISIGDGTAKVIGVADGIKITATATVDGTNLGSLSYTITTKEVKAPVISFNKTNVESVYAGVGTEIELPALTVKVTSNGPELDINSFNSSDFTYSDDAGATANVKEVKGKFYLVLEQGFVPGGDPIEVKVHLSANDEEVTKYGNSNTPICYVTVKPAIAWNGSVKDVYEGTYVDGATNNLEGVPTVVKYAGDEVTVTYSCTPANGVITVNPVSGAVTMVGPGNAVVTATATKEGVEVQKLSYNVTVTKNYADYTMYLTSQDFATGTKPNPTITATIVGSDQPVDVKFTGSFTKTDDGVVKVDGNRFSATNYSTAAQQAYSSVKVIGSGVGGGTLETSLLPDFKIITETVDSDNGVFPITQTLHGLYYRLTNVTAETLSSIEFIPSADQTILTNATAYYIIATQSEANKPEVIVNYELAATSNSISGKSSAYPNGQAVLLNFKPAKDETLYFICKHGDNYYAPTYQIIDKPIVAGVNYYNIEAGHAGYPDNEIFPIYQDKFVGGLSSIEYNEYQENQYIRIGDDDVLDNPVVYYYTVKTVNSRAANNIQSSLLRTLSFTQTTGVEDVMVDEPTAEPVYYNLQGVQIAHPAKGQIYVRVRGQKVDKVVF